MESLIDQFTLLSDQALSDKKLDPSAIGNLLKLFEEEAYKSWAAMERQHNREVEEAEIALQEAKDHLDSSMEAAMEELRRFEEGMKRMAIADLNSFVDPSGGAKKMGKLIEKDANIAS